MCKAWDAQTGLPPWLNCAHVSTHTHAQTHKSSHTRDTAGLCISGVAGGGGAGCSVLGTHVLNPLPLSVSSATHRGPVPCGCPVSPQPAASPVGGPSTGSRPPFAGLLAALWVGFLKEDPLELRWEGGKVSSENCPHYPRGRNVSVEGISFVDIGHQSIFLSWHAYGWACSVAWLGSQTNFLGNRPGGAHWHPLSCRPYELGRARGPDHLCPTSHKNQVHASLPVGLEGDAEGRAPVGLRQKLTAQRLG